MNETRTAPPSTADARAAALAYVLGILSGVFCLWYFRDRPFVRFHAWQSVLLWALTAFLMLGILVVPIAGGALAVGMFLGGLGVTVYLVWRAWNGAWSMLPLVGDIALEQALPRR